MADRAPFHFEFNPPANALPLADANFLTPSSLLTPGQIGTGVASIVKVLGAILAAGGLAAVLGAPKRLRRITQKDLDDDSTSSSNNSADAKNATGKNAAGNKSAGAAGANANEDDSWATAGRDCGSVVAAEATATAAAAAAAAGQQAEQQDPRTPQKQNKKKKKSSSQQQGSSASSASNVDGNEEEDDEDDDDDSNAEPPVFSTPRRATMAPESSHIGEISKRERKSARKSHAPPRGGAGAGATLEADPAALYTSPSKVGAAEEELRQRALAREARRDASAAGVVPQPPFALAIITPRSLQRYGNILKEGFDDMIARQQQQGSEAPLLKSIEVLMPEVGESASAFSARIRATKDFDILLIQYHGSQSEDPLAFVEYTEFEEVPRILLLHRPEEILQRHEQHVFKDAQFNVTKLLQEVDVVVLLGEAARPAILKQFALGASSASSSSSEEQAAAPQANVCVVPHGFYSLLSEAALAKPKQLAPIAVVGSNTTWSDMRWIGDLLQLRVAIQKKNQILATKKKNAANNNNKNKKNNQQQQAPQQVLVYGCGTFLPYIHPRTKEVVDELSELRQNCAESLVVVTASELASALSSSLASADEEVAVAALKNHLWKLSAQGSKVVVCQGELNERLQALHADLFDFNVQLYRELLRDFQPKIEYSGSLHARPGSSIPIVFEAPSSEDVQIEGMQLITVAYDYDADDSAAASSSAASAASSSWYPSPAYAPDFTRAVDAVFRYLAQPQHYQSHRVATATAAAQLTMRHVAGQYAAIIKQLFSLP